MSWSGIVAKSFTVDSFRDYVNSLDWNTWKPDFIVLHNTASPTLANRPNGLTLQQIKNLESYYRDDQKWSAGPHLFVDDKQIWVFTPLTQRGTHSPSWNSVSWGIEMLGDYDSEPFISGRGLLVQQHAAAAMGILLSRIGLKATDWKFHNQDPKTTHDCPGKFARAAKASIQGIINTHHNNTGPAVADIPWGRRI